MGLNPRELRGKIFDETDVGHEVPLEIKSDRLEELLSLLGTSQIADGMGKVLREIQLGTHLKNEIMRFANDK